MRFTEEMSLSPSREPPTRSASATRGPPAIFDVADVVVPPGLVFHSGMPHALDDRIIVLGVREHHTVILEARALVLVGHDRSKISSCTVASPSPVCSQPVSADKVRAFIDLASTRLTRVFAGLQPPGF